LGGCCFCSFLFLFFGFDEIVQPLSLLVSLTRRSKQGRRKPGGSGKGRERKGREGRGGEGREGKRGEGRGGKGREERGVFVREGFQKLPL
jgi:hypothetical protein